MPWKTPFYIIIITESFSMPTIANASKPKNCMRITITIICSIVRYITWFILYNNSKKIYFIKVLNFVLTNYSIKSLLAAKHQHAFELNKINKLGLNSPIPLNRKLRRREFLLTQTKFSFEFIKLLTNFGQDFNNKSDTFQLFKIDSPRALIDGTSSLQKVTCISRYEVITYWLKPWNI